jgi:putative addiction module component (TIGR02574 family)
MPTIDYSHMTPLEKIDLIGEIWDSMEAEDIPLSPEQAAELDRRYATLDEDIKYGITAAQSLALLGQRYR